MLIHVFKQKSLEEVSRIAPNCQLKYVALWSKDSTNDDGDSAKCNVAHDRRYAEQQ